MCLRPTVDFCICLVLGVSLFVNVKLSKLIFRYVGRDGKRKMISLEQNPIYSLKGSAKMLQVHHQEEVFETVFSTC